MRRRSAEYQCYQYVVLRIFERGFEFDSYSILTRLTQFYVLIPNLWL